MLQFNEVVKEYNTSGLRFGYKYYPDDDHGSVPLITEYEALRFIFDGYRVNLGRALANPSYLADHYKAVSENLGVPFQPSEAMISQLAGFAVGQDTAKAIQFYELAAQMYPKEFPELRPARRAVRRQGREVEGDRQPSEVARPESEQRTDGEQAEAAPGPVGEAPSVARNRKHINCVCLHRGHGR
jgi:hypothetical protein